MREVHEEIGYYLPPGRFKLIARYFGPHHSIPNTDARGEIFLARGVPIESLTVAEGRLNVIALDQLDAIRDHLSAPAQFGLDALLTTAAD